MNKINYCGIPEGYQAFVIKDIMKNKSIHCHVVGGETQLYFLKETISLIDPTIKIIAFPEWDTVPYDRVGVKADIRSARIKALVELIEQENNQKTLILTTVAALMQKVPEKTFFENSVLSLEEGTQISFKELQEFLTKNSYKNVNTVMEPGEFAIRGGLVDIFPTGELHPIRIDFFGDEVDSLKTFDETTQRTLKTIDKIKIIPVTEFRLTKESISLFRTKYRELFNVGSNDYFYENVTNGIAVEGLEHFLPLFHKKLVPILNYMENASISLDFQTEKRMDNREEQIEEYYNARCEALNEPEGFSSQKYFPIPKESLFISRENIHNLLNQYEVYTFSPFVEPNAKDIKVRKGRDFVDVRLQNPNMVFECVANYVKTISKKVVFSAATFGSLERITGLLREKGLTIKLAETWQEVKSHKKSPSIIVAPFVNGFENKDFLLITETDILGEKIIRKVSVAKSVNFITDVSSLNINDLVVHNQHGIGRFEGLFPLEISNAIHDCICLVYEGGDKLFIPVENIDVLSRYGSQEAALDHLGSLAFQNRKNKVKKDLFIMAEKLIQTASLRALNKSEKILPPHGYYQEFCARFPYTETEDQLRTIQEIEADLSSGKPMDRLVCGDVGFGKTEIALRSAFLTALAGKQVAIVVPTTLLAMQHTATFETRFKGFPVKIASLSRLTSAKKVEEIHEALKKGLIDIVIGTHSVLSKSIQFKNLGLVIVDEEQHFGVAHKERLKELQKGVHVLTLTATPIPRTLQLSLSGVRSLSIIATPPIDRLAVKTFVTPFDPVIIKEAILREFFRGGQVFFVCPRISDMQEVEAIIKKLVPEIRLVKAHGQMPSTQLERIMTDFAAKKYDLLVATSIVESGLDIPSVNTIIIYRADMFGLSALYQMRGRVGRGKLRAYAYLTTPPYQKLSQTAQKRLSVMQSLDSLGAGFTLASHDLDIRGAGNLLGDEQSGHIREVGISLYQKMLADAIRKLKNNKETEEQEEDFSPQISIGFPVLIPQDYIHDLDVRMELYHRAANLETEADIESFKAELIDRFGKYPNEVNNLFITLQLKILAKKAHIERVDVGPKGASIAFYKNTFPNPAKLIEFISSQMGTMKIRPDQKLLVTRPWDKIEDRLKGVEKVLQKIADLAD